MLTGAETREARQRAGLSQQELGQMVGVSMRSVGNYERGDTIPRDAAPRLEEALRPWLAQDRAHERAARPGLRDASDSQLLAEIARRFDRVPVQALTTEQVQEALAASDPEFQRTLRARARARKSAGTRPGTRVDLDIDPEIVTPRDLPDEQQGQQQPHGSGQRRG